MSSTFIPIQKIESEENLMPASSYRARWERVFQSFAIVCFHLRSIGADGRESFTGVLSEECGWHPTLQPIGHLLREREHELEKEGVILAIYHLAQPYYRALWASCSDEEKLALFHLARDRFLHSENPEIQRLLYKGLIVFDPNLRLINESFRRFVLLMAKEEQIVALEAQSSESLWYRINWSLGIVLVVFAVFLLLTQEQVRSSIGSLLSLFPVILPILVKSLEALQKGNTGAATPS